MHIYDYSFLKKDISAKTANLTNIIYDLRGRGKVRLANNKVIFEGLKKAAMIDSVSGSNAIEGIVTTKKRISEIVNDSAARTRDEHEISGYKDALNEIYTGKLHGLPGEKEIKHLHQLILSGTSEEAGKYKTIDNWIEERDEKGRLSIRFVPVNAKDTVDAMNQLTMALVSAYNDSDINNLLLIPCYIVDFLCIHPFSDGNGRISRLLTGMLMDTCGFDIGRYISIDKKIEEYKSNYYDALYKSSVGWHENMNSYEPFIIFFMQMIYRCYKDLDMKFIQGMKTVSKGKRVEMVLENAFVPLSKQEIASRVPEVSISTVERVLDRMLKNREIEKIGSFRDARYRKI